MTTFFLYFCSQDNNSELCSFINDGCKLQGHKLIIGDFNFPNINWKTWSTSGQLEMTFIDILRKKILHQYIETPTRARGSSVPNILDLVISDEPFIENIDFKAPLGKSDHCVLQIQCKVNPTCKQSPEKYAFSKGDYTGLRQSLQSVLWEDLFKSILIT